MAEVVKLPEIAECFGALILFGAQLTSEFDTTRQSPPARCTFRRWT